MRSLDDDEESAEEFEARQSGAKSDGSTSSEEDTAGCLDGHDRSCISARGGGPWWQRRAQAD